MSKQNEGVMIAGFFTIIAACIGGAFLIFDTLIEKGLTINGPSVQVGDSPTSIVTTLVPTTIIVPELQTTYQEPYFFQDGIPNNNSINITVPTGEIHAMTSGTICVMNVCLPGGRDRGSVVIFLSGATYEVTGLVPNWNWHGAYYASTDQWRIIADKLAEQQRIPGTCSDGDGCSIVDVLVVGPTGVVEQYQD